MSTLEVPEARLYYETRAAAPSGHDGIDGMTPAGTG